MHIATEAEHNIYYITTIGKKNNKLVAIPFLFFVIIGMVSFGAQIENTRAAYSLVACDMHFI